MSEHHITFEGEELDVPGRVFRVGSLTNYPSHFHEDMPHVFGPAKHITLPSQPDQFGRTHFSVVLSLGTATDADKIDYAEVHKRLWEQLGLVQYGGAISQWLDERATRPSPGWIGETLDYFAHENPVEGAAMYGLLRE